MTVKVMIRCDAAPEIGFGHLVRCLALADELRNQHGYEVAFAMWQGPQGSKQVKKHGYLVHELSGDDINSTPESAWLQQLVNSTETQVLILDARTDLPAEAIRQIRAKGVLIITIDDSSNRRLEADLAFYPPVPQVDRLDWIGFTGKKFVGWDWVLLRPEFARYKERQRSEVSTELKTTNLVKPLTVLVTMGGSDPAGLTLLALEALDEIGQKLRVIVIVGGSFMHEPALKEWLTHARRVYDLKRDVQDMPALMAQADLAIASFGVTAYELAFMGVPALFICLTDDHEESAEVFVRLGFAKNLGCRKRLDHQQLSQAIEQFIGGGLQKARLALHATKMQDGKAAMRISAKIFDSLASD